MYSFSSKKRPVLNEIIWEVNKRTAWDFDTEIYLKVDGEPTNPEQT